MTQHTERTTNWNDMHTLILLQRLQGLQETPVLTNPRPYMTAISPQHMAKKCDDQACLCWLLCCGKALTVLSSIDAGVTTTEGTSGASTIGCR